MNGALRGCIAGLAFVATVLTVVTTVGNEVASRRAPSNKDEATQPSEQKGPAIARRMRRASV